MTRQRGFRKFRSVKGLEGVAPPVGAVVTIGQRSDRGQPIDKDRWFFKSPTLVKKRYPRKDGTPYETDARDLHPDFKGWNDCAAKGRIWSGGGASRDMAILRGHLAGTADDSFEAKLWAPELPGEKNPTGRYPACTGDGVTADRFVGFDGSTPLYREVGCEGCKFREKRGDQDPACNLRASLLFWPRWPDGSTLPVCLTRWTSQSPVSADRALGMMNWASKKGREMGIPDPFLFGLQFTMVVTTGTSATIRASFPLVEFKIDTPLPQFFLAQKDQQASLAAGPGFVTARLDDGERLALEAGDTADLAGPPGDAPGSPESDILDATPLTDEEMKAIEDAERQEGGEA